jgi:hypothetical protein
MRIPSEFVGRCTLENINYIKRSGERRKARAKSCEAIFGSSYNAIQLGRGKY